MTADNCEPIWAATHKHAIKRLLFIQIHKTRTVNHRTSEMYQLYRLRFGKKRKSVRLPRECPWFDSCRRTTPSPLLFVLELADVQTTRDVFHVSSMRGIPAQPRPD